MSSSLLLLINNYILSLGLNKTSKKLVEELKSKNIVIDSQENKENLLDIYNNYIKSIDKIVVDKKVNKSKKVEHVVEIVTEPTEPIHDKKSKKSKKELIDLIPETVTEPIGEVKKSKKSKKEETIVEEVKIEVPELEPVKEKKSKKSKKEETVEEEIKVEAPAKVSKKPNSPAIVAKKSKKDVKPIEEVLTSVTAPVVKSGKNAPFQRIDPTQFVIDDGLKDNSFFAKNKSNQFGTKAAKDLIVVRGKDFRREMTKKKRSTFLGGEVDMGVNSYKFDSD